MTVRSEEIFSRINPVALSRKASSPAASASSMSMMSVSMK